MIQVCSFWSQVIISWYVILTNHLGPSLPTQFLPIFSSFRKLEIRSVKFRGLINVWLLKVLGIAWVSENTSNSNSIMNYLITNMTLSHSYNNLFKGCLIEEQSKGTVFLVHKAVRIILCSLETWFMAFSMLIHGYSENSGLAIFHMW